ncbi:MAG TPA: IclR family transcriptional regulator [Steroidobacteraceae bacterium]|nr:IclR family transcriptional regulator [Steroidobacteraceae bacterium]
MPASPAPGGMGPERVVMVLEQLAEAAGPLSHSELAVTLGIAKSTLTALLKTLQRVGYVQSVGRGYAPGPRFLALAQRLAPQARHHESIRRLLMPLLQNLAARSGETVTLAVPIGSSGQASGTILAIAHVESPNPIRFVPGIGEPQAMLATAAGRAILAFSDGPSPDEPALRKDLAEIRRLGYAIHRSDLTVIAAPVLNADGRPIGAISVIGPSFRVMEPVEAIWPLLRGATHAASHSIQRATHPVEHDYKRG